MTRWTKEQLAEYMLRFQDSPESTDIPDQGKESRLQAKIEQWARDKGFPFFHDRSRKKNTPGWPDLTIAMPEGVVLFLELKSAKGVLRKEQAEIRQQMIYLGHHHFVVKSYKGFLSIIQDHDYGKTSL